MKSYVLNTNIKILKPEIADSLDLLKAELKVTCCPEISVIPSSDSSAPQ